MRTNLKKIAYFCLVSVVTLTASLGYAAVLHASSTHSVLENSSPVVTDQLDDTHVLHAFKLDIEANKDTDKLINNVKVFYNPISEQISVSFKLGKQNTVAIKVMDALGNEVLQLMNGSLDAGTQNLSFDPTGKLNSGFYFVRLVAGSETIVKRFSVR